MNCSLCPRACRVDRSKAKGFCGEYDRARVALIEGRPYMRHRFEEPVISGTRGSGALFFSGCNLRCVYCQNQAISRGEGSAVELDEQALAELMVEASKGADTLSLVTAAHFVGPVAGALTLARERIGVPVVYNSSGYETAAALQTLDGLVDVYLPDFKHVDGIRAEKYSGAADYPTVAAAALAEMARQAGPCVVENGILRRGLLIRHLVLPGGRAEGAAVMREIAARFPSAMVSVMRQYTPQFCPRDYPELRRRVTGFEYDTVINEAARLGLTGFMQGRESAATDYTPDFRG